VTAHEERTIIIHKYPIYRGFSILIGIFIAAGLLLAMDLSNSAKDVFAGTEIGSLLSLRTNEKITLCVFAVTAIACALVLFFQSLYFGVQERRITPVL
jgi:hypothetical protein